MKRSVVGQQLTPSRNGFFQACIVRVMKDRKILQHAELITEVVKQLSTRFKPSPPAIKQAIERLIEKEYLERDEQDRRKLKYLVSFARSPPPPARAGRPPASCFGSSASRSASSFAWSTR